MNNNNAINKSADTPGAAQVHQIINEVLRRRDAGEDLPDQAILDAHPELSSELKLELDKLQRIQIAWEAADEMNQSGSQAAPPSEVDAGTPIGMGIGLAARLTLPGYQLIREIAYGGQAVVYEAIQQSTSRKVAVKLIKDGQLASPRERARFDREVQILAALQHPNIVGIIDRGVTKEGPSFIVMEFIIGRPLDVYLGMSQANGNQPGGDPATALHLFLKICDAVNAAHLRGIVHRDLKPSNILVGENGEPHILDFGLARMAISAMTDEENPQAVTITGQFIGSLPWASPEQAEGVTSRIDMRTDVYSLGVMLYQALTGGKFPYEVVGTIHEVLHNILTAQPAPPSRVLAAAQVKQQQNKRRYRRKHPAMINPSIEAIVLKALSKRREDRYQTAGELARDIANYLAGWPTIAGGVVRRKVSWGWVAAMAASAIAFAAVATTCYLWSLLPPQPESPSTASSRTQSNSTPPTVAPGVGGARTPSNVVHIAPPANHEPVLARVPPAVAPGSGSATPRRDDVVSKALPAGPTGTPNLFAPPTEASTAHANPSLVGWSLLPPDWKSLQTIVITDRGVYAGGRSLDDRGRLGIFAFAGPTPGFQDRSARLPPTYGGVQVLARDGDRLLLAANAPETRRPELAQYSPDLASCTDLSNSLHLAAPFEWWITAMDSNGADFLIAGSGAQTPLILYEPRTRKFTSLAHLLPHYVSTSAIASDGISFLIDGVGALPGSELGTPPVLGRVFNTGVFDDLSPTVPPELGVMLASGFDGKEFLLQGVHKTTRAQMLFLFDPQGGRFTDVSSDLALPNLNIRCVCGMKGSFVIGGRRGNQAYLALYIPGGGPAAPQVNLLPMDAQEVTVIAASGRYVAVGGHGRQGREFLCILDMQGARATLP